MEYLKNQKSAIPVVLFAGLLWSFGPLVVRYMDQPNLFPWQYVLTRGITIFLIFDVAFDTNVILKIVGKMSLPYV